MVHNDTDAWVASYWEISLVTKNWDDLSLSMSIKIYAGRGSFWIKQNKLLISTKYMKYMSVK